MKFESYSDSFSPFYKYIPSTITTTKMNPKEDHLNSLLEDALTDLLDEGPPDTVDSSSKEQQRKINDVTGGTNHSGGICETENVNNESGITSSVKISKKKQSTRAKRNDLGVDEEEMNRFFEQMSAQLKAELPKLDPDEAREKINESVPQIFDLMQNLLSKELLYPALLDLSPKFDIWLEKNSVTLSKTDKKRYRQQRDIIKEIIDIFDDESLDSQERFERNLDLMEKMQSLGSPPEELTVPESVGKCSIM